MLVFTVSVRASSLVVCSVLAYTTFLLSDASFIYSLDYGAVQLYSFSEAFASMLHGPGGLMTSESFWWRYHLISQDPNRNV